ncbi:MULTISPECIES: DUF2202 domain-containing protein [unclassified Fusibacter]|uniref:ferritin-like domain-containing protein n=1 Tax=unclassified Fusibacter TaxID=2624464 RepID=UPI0010128F40|nr:MULTISPECIES: DUF2202 domain-containing protein [unclassified Fusibacter]MCK8060304.1 DUF2202 domain-containing protein [Fusibacter sp. A2]NPE20407.1 DUF2202 domain-containing protein [Fusibacter sp. A1]RXV63612.1 DUF2202 domain-containing protein [Fusibacter sp. A1]
MKKLISTVMIGILVISNLPFADAFGHEGTTDDVFTLESMLTYAIEDEYLAHDSYEAIIDAFDVSRPFSNIIKAESRHITWVEDLMATYQIEIPTIDTSSHVVLPSTLSEAYAVGVQAEIDNIALYQKFLEQDLPEDVRAVFEQLIKGSEAHLNAFETNLSRSSNSNQRRGRNR